MKKLALLGLTLVLVGCSNVSAQQQGNEAPVVADAVKNDEMKQEEVSQNDTLTSIKIVEQVISEPVGDRTADNIGQENGEYFAIGSDIVKCSDYDNIHIVVELTNNRDELFTTNMMAWSAEMGDGYKLNFNNNNYSDIQIQSGSNAKIELDILKEKTIKGDKIILTYTDINYDDTYAEFFKKALSGATEEECRKEYPQYFDESIIHKFEIALQ